MRDQTLLALRKSIISSSRLWYAARNACWSAGMLVGALRIGIGQRRIGEHRLERAIARQLHLAEVRDVARVHREQQHVAKHVVVVRPPPSASTAASTAASFRASRRSRAARWMAPSSRAASSESCFSAARGRRPDRHEAVVEERIDGPRRLDGELRVQPHRRCVRFPLACSTSAGIGAEARRGGERACARRCVLLLEQREDGVARLSDVDAAGRSPPT